MSARWSTLLNPDFLARTYPAWAKGAAAVDAPRLFVEHGVAALAALDEGLAFDPGYFRETHPAWVGVDDVACYRAWLFDLDAAGPPSPARHLDRLGLRLPRYPEAFPWRFYARVRPGAGAHRWAALDDFVADGFEAEGDALPYGEGAGAFLVALARSYVFRRDALAVRAFELAAARGPLAAADRHELGDCHLRQRSWGAAHRCYGDLVRDGAGTVWTVRNFVLAATALRDWDGAAAALTRSRAALGRDGVWRNTRTELATARFEARLAGAQARYADGERETGDAALAAAVGEAEALLAEPGRPPRARRPRGRGRVVLFANLDDAADRLYRVEHKVRLLDRLGRPSAVIPMQKPDALDAVLADAAAVIFFGVPAVPDQLQALLAAKFRGVATIYETQDPVFDPALTPVPFASFRGRLAHRHYEDLLTGVPLYRALASRCDFGLAPTRAVADGLGALVRRRTAFVLEDMAEPPGRDAGPGAEPRMVLRASRFLFLGPEPGTLGAALLTALDRVDRLTLTVSGYVQFTADFNRFGDRIVELGGDGLHRTEDVLAGSTVNVAPRFGPGDDAVVARSWLEAAGFGVPTLMTAADAAGLGLRPGEDALAGADEAAVLAGALAEPARAAGVGAAAKRRVEITRNETVLAAQLGEALGRVAGRWWM